MAHLIYEITDNLQNAGIESLLKKSNQVLIDQGDVFPVGGIRSRVLWLRDYCVADGSHPEDAFVHLTVKIGAGRPERAQRQVGDALFAMVCDHFAHEYSTRSLALSMELVEFSESGTWKKNNIHARYRK